MFKSSQFLVLCHSPCWLQARHVLRISLFVAFEFESDCVPFVHFIVVGDSYTIEPRLWLHRACATKSHKMKGLPCTSSVRNVKHQLEEFSPTVIQLHTTTIY